MPRFSLLFYHQVLQLVPVIGLHAEMGPKNAARLVDAIVSKYPDSTFENRDKDQNACPFPGQMKSHKTEGQNSKGKPVIRSANPKSLLPPSRNPS